jgi:hypothetical protein
MRQYLRSHPDLQVIVAGGFVLLALEAYVTAIGLRNAQRADIARSVSESLGG